MEPAAYAFLFDEDSPAVQGPRQPLADFLTIALAAFRRASFRIRRGSLLLHFRADRPTEVTVAPGRYSRYPTTSRASRLDPDLFRLLLWELCDSIAERWTTTHDEDLPLLLGGRDVWVISFYPLSHDAALAFDRSGQEMDGYLGAVEIDPGNPLQRDLLWASLYDDLYFDRGSLMHVQGFDLPEERYSLMGSGHWWNALGFDEVGWHEERADPDRRPPGLPTAPLSDRGQLTQNRITKRATPSHLERVVTGLAARSARDATPVTLTTTLPGAAHAIIDQGKLTQYVLNPEHDKGADKARLINELLEITADDWRYLAAQIQHGLLNAPVHRVRSETWGVKYHADIAVVGKNGLVKALRTAWIVETDSAPRLTTAYMAPREVDVHTLPPPVEPAILETPPSDSDGWQSLFELAHARGTEAAEAVVPTPMFVSGCGYPEGTIGGAAITVADARRGFARWLIRSGHAHRGYRGGAELLTGLGSSERASAYARAFASVLQLNGVDCAVREYLD